MSKENFESFKKLYFEKEGTKEEIKEIIEVEMKKLNVGCKALIDIQMGYKNTVSTRVKCTTVKNCEHFTLTFNKGAELEQSKFS
jgi:hypothetical protein